MNTRERFLNTLSGTETDRMPAACLQTGTLDLMRLSGAYWPEAHRDAKKMALLSLAASTYAGVECACLPFDRVVDAEALGAKIGYGDQVTAPFVTETPIRSLDDIWQLNLPEVRNAGRMPLIDEAIAKIKTTRPDLPIVVTVQAPFTLSVQLRGQDQAMADLASQPESYLDYVDFIARWSSFSASHFIEAGADAVMMVDGQADDSVLGPEMYESFALPGQRKVVDTAEEVGAPSILHIGGDIAQSTEMMVRSGADAISIGQGTSIARTKEMVKGRCRVIGNIDPCNVLLRGTPSQVEAEVRRSIDEGADLATPGSGLSPKTPLENLQAMTDAVRKYGQKGR